MGGSCRSRLRTCRRVVGLGPAPPLLLPRVLQHLLALLRTRALPLLAKRPALVRRQAAELAEILAQLVLAIRRQGPELLPAITQLLSLVGRQLAPALETIARRAPLVR